MGNDTDEFERIAPTPWRPATEYHACIRDANGSLLDMSKCRDLIIARVNFCAGLATKDLEAWDRSEVLTKLREALLDA